MADPHLLTVLGADASPARGIEPDRILSALAAEPAPRHSGPRLPDGDTWLTISGLPPVGSGADPIAVVLGSASGGLAEFTVVVHHTDAGGLRVHLSGGHPAVTARVRTQLAPYADVTAHAPSAAATSGTGIGVRFRLQPEAARAEQAPAGTRVTLLHRLTGIPGDWSVVLQLASVHQLEVRDAQSGVLALAQLAAENLSITRQEAANRQVTTTSAAWSRVQGWTEALLGQLAQGAHVGLWKASTWAFGADEWTAHQVVAALRGGLAEEQGRRFLALDAPVGSGDAPITVLTTPEAASLLAAPPASVPGLAVRPAPPAARRPDVSATRITLGRYASTDIPATIGLDDLEGHAFLTGTTGSGKSTTLHRLLAEAWNSHGVPFLVLDPVKDEYTPIAPLFRGGLRVITGSELSLNLLAPWPGEDPRQHVAQIAQAFRGAFTMPSPTPYVVTQLFDQLALQQGGPIGTELFDVRDAVDPLVLSLGYAAEAQSNIRASLLTRLNLLLSPTRAHRFAWPDSAMVEGLFDRPTVVTLADLVDDEERSFLVLLLALATWSRARTRTNPRTIEHLLVLEEAHRVLPEVSPTADPESGSAMATSARILTSMLTEVRAYGEQVIVVDQSPSRVASDVVRNTNLKIAHRIVAGDDQATVAAAIGLADDDRSVLGSLERGRVVLSTRRETSPQTVEVDRAVAVEPGVRAEKPARSVPTWPCCGGESPERHFRAWHAAAQAESIMALFLAGCRVGAGDGADDARAATLAALKTIERTLDVRADCLAWAGLRRLLVAERQAGFLPSATAVGRQLAALFDVWVSGEPPTVASSKAHGVPRLGSIPCPACGSSCGIRHPAAILARSGPRSGLHALATAAWRTELAGVGDWAREERDRLGALLGPAGADTLVTCQIHQAVRDARLSTDVVAHLLTRAGLTRP